MAKTEAELKDAFQKDPAQVDAFIALRRLFQQKKRFDELAQLYETRAAAMAEGLKAAELYNRAADIHFEKLRDEEGGTRCLLLAVRADSSQRRPVEKLKTILKEQSRWEEYLGLLATLAEARAGDPAQARNVARLNLEMGTLYEEHFSRTDKAMYHYQMACRMDATLVPALQAARRIYRQTGDWPMVCQLMEAELAATIGAKARFDLLLSLAQIQSGRLHDLAGAGRSLQEALAARPGEVRALEALANVYANPEWPQEGGPQQAAKIFVQIAQIHRAAKQLEESTANLQRALRADPASREAFRLIEDLYRRIRKYRELEQLYAERLQIAAGAEVVDLLMKRAALLEEHLGDRAEAVQCYESILPHEPPGGAAAAMLAELYHEQGEFKKLAALREIELESVDDVTQRIARMMELALIYRDELGDDDKTGIYLHGVLQMDPNNPEALDYYREHFRHRGDYRGLSDLIAFSIEGAIESRVRRSVIVSQLKELAEISEQPLGDLPRAMDAWRRIQEVDPTQLEAQDARRRLAKKERMWASLLAALERDLQMAQTHEQQVDALLRMGQAYHDKGIDPLRGIEILEEVLRSYPGEPTALALLCDLYDREANLEGLASVYRRQLEIVHDPSERLAILRDLGKLYHERLKQLRETGWACTQILDMVPGDQEALRRLTDVLQAMEDWPKLIKTLRYHAQTADTREDRAESFRRMADIATNEIQDPGLAAESWEGIRSLYPDDQEALRQLLSLYEKLGRWEDLADLLEVMAEDLSRGDDQAHQAHLRRLARVADTRLGDANRALEAWQAVSEMIPQDTEALAALARLYYTQEDWDSLADVMERQIPLTEDDQKAVNLSFRLAEILHGKLDRPKEAIDTLQNVLDGYDPGNVDALERLRQLYAAIGETAKSVRIAERQLLLVEGDEKIRLSLDIAAAWRDDVGDDEQAIKAYENVLEIDPSNPDALSALVVLYTRSGRWQELISTNQLLFDFADNDRERLRLLYQIAEVYEERLDEPTLAFSWYRQAYQLYPQDRGTLTSLSRAAAEHGLWEELIEVYEEVRAQAQQPSDHLEAAGRIAEICEHKLSDPQRAFDVLRGALVVDLTGEELLPELERLAEEVDLWDGIVEVYERVLKHIREPASCLSILHRCARVLEDHLGDQKGALLRLQRSFQIDPNDDATQTWLLRVAEDQASWQDVLDVYAAQYTEASTIEEKLELVRLSAPVVEDRVGDKVKAFRAWLHAFLMAHEDEDILAEVWRLARDVGEYDDDVRAQDERARQATQLAEKRAAEAAAAAERRDRTGPISRLGRADFSEQVPRLALDDVRLDITQELNLEELEFVDDEPLPPQRQDPTMELKLSDLVDIQSVRTGRVERLDATLELQLVDLMDISGDRPLTNPQAHQPEDRREVAAPASDYDLPPPKSAWEEFSRAWAMVPAPDVITKIQHCHEIARIWREGPADLDRAFWALRKGLELEPLHEGTQQTIEEVAQEASALEQLGETYLEILGDSHGVDLIVALNLLAADLFSKADKHGRAETRYKEILSIKPDHKESFEKLQQMYRDQERWSELAELDERQMDDMLDQLPAGPERQAKLRELAALYEEKLDQPYEALSVVGRLIAELPEDLDCWRAVARLAARTEGWSKAVEAMGKVEEYTDDDDEAHQVRQRVAAIYRNDLELPDRAIDCYRALADEDPSDDGALLALQELLVEHESWEDLEDVLSRRAEIAAGQDWIDLIRHRARILDEHLISPAEAAQCLRQLYEEHAHDEELASDLIRLLRAAEQYPEAASLLRERIETSEGAGAPPGEIAALLVRLAVIQSHDLGETEAARNALDRALETVPDYPSALGELARLHKHDEDWESYGEARMREAEAAPDRQTKLSALLEAAQVYTDKLNDREEAKACLDKALALDRNHFDALGGLADLAAHAGDWQRAIGLHRRQLDQVEDPAQRASLLTAMGTLTLTGGRDEEEAAALFRQALEEKNDDVPAVIALADISYRHERWDEAEELLTTALPRLDGQPEMAARLAHRLGGIYLRLDKVDEGKKILSDIDRKNPGQILIKLALGLNRFQARRWREAARVLSALPEHEDANQFPEEVAQACCVAAEAETKQRRPTKAPPLWDAALQLKPDHMPAIDALVSYHTERGATPDAARYLRAQADATTDPTAKVQLLDSLGDLYMDKIEDDAAAMVCFREALDAAEPVESRHMSILEKLFPLCRSLGDDAEAARIIGLTLAFTEDDDLRMPREIQAADAYLALGEVDRAQGHLQAALRIDPSNEQATVALVDLYDQTSQFKELADLLSTYLDSLEEASEEAEWSRRAALFERLAETYRQVWSIPRAPSRPWKRPLSWIPRAHPAGRSWPSCTAKPPSTRTSRS